MPRRATGRARDVMYPVRWFRAELEDMKRKAGVRGMGTAEYLRWLVAKDRPIHK